MAQVIYVRVRLELQDGIDHNEVVEDMDYNFEHDQILSSEIVDVE